MSKQKAKTKLTKGGDLKDSAQVVTGGKPNKFKYTKVVESNKKGLVKAKTVPGVEHFYFGTHDLDLFNKTMVQICDVCARGKLIAGNEQSTLSANAALAAIVEIDPKDCTELLLATQMVTAHNIAMEMSRRAISGEQTIEVANFNFNQMIKLMRTYTIQVEALNKYRNKGKQKITVKHQHVNVNDGGQAVIGDVKGGG